MAPCSASSRNCRPIRRCAGAPMDVLLITSIPGPALPIYGGNR